MYIGNNFMVNVNFYHHPAHQKYFIDEASAREYANRFYKDPDAKFIELLKRQRVGYVRAKAIHRHHEGATHWIEK